MSFASRNSEPQRVDGRTMGEPHPDAQRNLQYCIHKMREIDLLESMEFFYQDLDPRTNIIIDPKCIFFSWNEGVRLYSNPVSFHMSNLDFQATLTRCVQWMVEKGHARRVGQKRVKESLI